MKLTGDPKEDARRRRISATKRARGLLQFRSRINRGAPDECWPYTGYRDRLGYGKVSAKVGPGLAHRLAYELEHGPIPSGLCVCHACDNPSCCNPAHLWIGTPADNARDRDAKERQPVLYGEDSGNAKLTRAQVDEIRAAVAAGETKASITRRFPIGPTQVGRIVRREVWK